MNVRDMSPRRLAAILACAVAVALATGVPTDLIDTPYFGREIPPTWWSYPVWIATSVLSGVLIASYALDRVDQERPARMGGAGGVVAFFAIGCPVCNKFVLLAVGTSGALTWFEPIQPLLAVVALGLLVVALRLRTRATCPLPAARD